MRVVLLSIFIVFCVFMGAPFFAGADEIPSATGLIPCVNDCGFDDLVQLANNVITFLFVISTVLAAISFAWAGWLMLSSAGNTSQVEKAKGIFYKVAWGFIIALSAWLIVNFITSALLDKSLFENIGLFI